MLDLQQTALREQLVELLQGGSAHLELADAFSGIREADWSAKAGPHTLWQLLEHMRFTLQDLLAFSTRPEYTAPKWPDDYWPVSSAPETAQAPKASLAALHKALAEMTALVEDETVDLFAPIPWGDGQTLLHEVLLAGDHTSYHLGQAMIVRKTLENA